jgi:hypothetical protein
MALGKEVTKASVSQLSIVNMAKNRMGFRSTTQN